jgi:outer membrane protein insertion porin family
MQGAIFIDAGSLFNPGGLAELAVADEGSYILDAADVRLSTGVSLIWQSPLGPLRADLAQALLKAEFDRTELFRFGASTNF